MVNLKETVAEYGTRIVGFDIQAWLFTGVSSPLILNVFYDYRILKKQAKQQAKLVILSPVHPSLLRLAYSPLF